MLQTDLFNIHSHENNRESQTILENNLPYFNKQCQIVFDALMRGEILTTTTALIKYRVGDLRARMRDLRNTVLTIDGKEENIRHHEQLSSNRYKSWWMDSNDIMINKILIEKLNLLQK